MKVEEGLKIGSEVCSFAGGIVTAVGFVVHPVLPLGVGLLGVAKVCDYASNSLSIAATIVENRDDISDSIHDAAETVREGVDKVLSSANEDLHDAGKTIRSLFNHFLEGLEENVEDANVTSSGEVTNDVAEDTLLK